MIYYRYSKENDNDKKRGITMFDFYKRQIQDFDRSLNDIDALFETLANDESLTNDEYFALYEMAINKFRI